MTILTKGRPPFMALGSIHYAADDSSRIGGGYAVDTGSTQPVADDPTNEAAESVDQLHKVVDGRTASVLMGDDASRMGWVTNGAMSAIPLLGRWSVNAVKRRLMRIYGRRYQEMFNAYLEAIGVLDRHSEIRGTEMVINLANGSLIDPRSKDHEPYGMVYQAIHLARLIDEGKKIDAMEALIAKDVEFEGFWLDRRTKKVYLIPLREDAVADALSGDTTIEIKNADFGGNLCAFVVKLLWLSNVKHVEVIGREGSSGIGFDKLDKAVKFVKQLLKFRQLIIDKKTKKHELHIRSTNAVPLQLVNAIHRMFPEGAVEVIWYEGIDYPAISIHPLEAPLDWDAKPSFIATPTPRPGRRQRVTKDYPPILAPTKPRPQPELEPEPKPAPESIPLQPTSAPVENVRDVIISFAYTSGVYAMADHEDSVIGDFVDWLLETRLWNQETASLSDTEIGQRTEEFYREWSDDP